ncbi:MAG: sugar ABC transporter permease [Candidatus Eisenbacteria bacterium]|uniref:Sugar ABC transporter permease n=1 Tax=Eiseniibacteriota bacterium TaxID=2212470 RepID=A0A849SWC4_UNCEI|nr:sugar ABC transporter permease [Candidatus Eisenbacteria bacterium]
MTVRALRRQDATAWVFLAPALILIAVFFVVPVVTGFVMSFTDFDIYAIGDPSVARWIGGRNYQQALTDPEFWNALRNTFVYVLVGGPLSVAASLVAAVLVNAKLARFKSTFRVIFYMPVVTTLVAVAIVWRYLYHPRYGLIDSALAGLGIQGPDWLGDPHLALFSIIILAVWKNFGYNMLIFVAGLQSIPAEHYEAARLDGAGGLAQFRHITLPALAPTFLFVGINTMVASFQLFPEPYVMTQGGPLRSTVSIVLLMYEQGFRWWRLGLASSIAFLLFGIMLIGAMIQLRIQKGRGA